MTHPAKTHHPAKDDSDIDAPFAKRSDRETGKPDQLKEQTAEAEDRQEALVDEALEETFPASDPISVKRIT